LPLAWSAQDSARQPLQKTFAGDIPRDPTTTTTPTSIITACAGHGKLSSRARRKSKQCAN